MTTREGGERRRLRLEVELGKESDELPARIAAIEKDLLLYCYQSRALIELLPC